MKKKGVEKKEEEILDPTAYYENRSYCTSHIINI